MIGPEAERLARDNIGQCRRIARSLTRWRPWEADEAISHGLVGLARAVRTFEPDRAADVDRAFAWHAFMHIRSYMRSYLRLTVAPSGYRPRPGRPTAGAPRVVSLSEPVADGAPPVGWGLEWEDLILELARRLPKKHAAVFRMHYLEADAWTVDGAARRLGICSARAHELHREALAMLRERFARKGA